MTAAYTPSLPHLQIFGMLFTVCLCRNVEEEETAWTSTAKQVTRIAKSIRSAHTPNVWECAGIFVRAHAISVCLHVYSFTKTCRKHQPGGTEKFEIPGLPQRRLWPVLGAVIPGDPDLYTTHAKSINPVVAECENVLIQSPWIGKTWIYQYQSIQACNQVHTNRLNHVKRMAQMIQSNQSISPIYMVDLFWKIFYFVDLFWKRSISLTLFWEAFDFVDLFWDIWNHFNWFNHTSPSKSIYSVTHFVKTDWLSHQSTHLEKERNQFNQSCGKINRFKSINSVDLIGIQVRGDLKHFGTAGLYLR